MKKVHILFLTTIFFTGIISVYSQEKDVSYNYLGRWKIESCFYVDRIYSEWGDLSFEEAKDYLGEIIEYKEDHYIFRDTIY